MKGITLPINTLVIVTLAVVVLLGLTAVYFTGWNPFGETTGLESIKNEACRQLLQEKRCNVATNTITISNFDADGDGSNDPGTGWNWNAPNPCAAVQANDNLASLCYCQRGRTSEAACRQLCECPTVPQIGGFNLEVYAWVGGSEISARVATILGDVNWDGFVDITDMNLIIDAFGTQPGMTKWNPDADLNCDDRVEAKDNSIWNDNNGKTVPIYTTSFKINLQAGSYTLRAKYDTQYQNKDVTVVSGSTTVVNFMFT